MGSATTSKKHHSKGSEHYAFLMAGVDFRRDGMKPLVGQLVEIFDLPPRGLKVFNESEQRETEELVDLQDEDEESEIRFPLCGVCQTWLSESEVYVVKTCEGRVVCVPEAKLREWSPPPVEEGGFDVAWPLDRSQPGKVLKFADAVVSALADRGFCLIQTFMSKEERQAAWHSGQEQDRYFFRMKQEVETGYMGFDSNNKIAPCSAVAYFSHLFFIVQDVKVILVQLCWYQSCLGNPFFDHLFVSPFRPLPALVLRHGFKREERSSRILMALAIQRMRSWTTS